MLTGRLLRWNDDKGYGFIRLESENRDIFIHISVLSQMSRRPIVGDVIFFEMEPDENGKFKAVNAKIEGVQRISPSAQQLSLVSIQRKPNLEQYSKKQDSRVERSNYRNNKNQGIGNRFVSKILYLVIVVGAISAYDYFVSHKTDTNITYTSTPEKVEQQQSQFNCQGKTHCSEMTSCEEATFYINSCPGTKMDGDGDGIPCESQWCN